MNRIKKAHLILAAMLIFTTGCGKKDKSSLKEDMGDASQYGKETSVEEGDGTAVNTEADNGIPEHVDYSFAEGQKSIDIDADVKANGYDSVAMYNLERLSVTEEYIKSIAEKLFDGGKYTSFRYYDNDMTDEELMELKALADAEREKLDEAEIDRWSYIMPRPNEILQVKQTRDLQYVYHPELSKDQILYTRYICAKRTGDNGEYEEGGDVEDYGVYFKPEDIDFDRFNEVRAEDFCYLVGEVDGKTWVLMYDVCYLYNTENPNCDFNDIKNNTFRKDEMLDHNNFLGNNICIKPVIRRSLVTQFFDARDNVRTVFGAENPVEIEEAEKTARAALQRLGIENQELIYTFDRYDQVDNVNVANGYAFIYGLDIGNVNNLFVTRNTLPILLQMDIYEGGYTIDPGYSYVSVSEDGVESILLGAQYNMTDALTTKANLLDFDKINNIAIEWLKEYNNSFYNVEISSIEFGYTIVNYEGKLATVPVWYYYEKPQGAYDIGRNAAFCINAIDGSLIASGYNENSSYYALEY